MFTSNEPGHSISLKTACAPSEDWYHPRKVIWVFADHQKTLWTLFYPQSVLRRLRPDCINAPANLSLRWARMQSCRKCYDLAHMAVESSVVISLIKLHTKNIMFYWSFCLENFCLHVTQSGNKLRGGYHFYPHFCLRHQLGAYFKKTISPAER